MENLIGTLFAIPSDKKIKSKGSWYLSWNYWIW
jgi:hypothetical protein